jgi:hypothetical protein
MEQLLNEEPYGGVPLGAEAAVVVPQFVEQAERSDDENHPALDAWRG